MQVWIPLRRYAYVIAWKELVFSVSVRGVLAIQTFHSASVPTQTESRGFFPLALDTRCVNKVYSWSPAGYGVTTSAIYSFDGTTSLRQSSFAIPIVSYMSIMVPEYVAMQCALSLSIEDSRAFITFPVRAKDAPITSKSDIPMYPVLHSYGVPQDFTAASGRMGPHSLWAFVVPFVVLWSLLGLNGGALGYLFYQSFRNASNDLSVSTTTGVRHGQYHVGHAICAGACFGHVVLVLVGRCYGFRVFNVTRLLRSSFRVF